jgi:hypothetical protein
MSMLEVDPGRELMTPNAFAEIPVEGETFSLFGLARTSEVYFRQVSRLADRLLEIVPDCTSLIELLRTLGKSRRRLRHLAKSQDGGEAGAIVRAAGGALAPYTERVERHLASLPLHSRLDRTLSMSREQYHLAMVEIELVNRENERTFNEAGKKLAFLPHCLRDRSRACRSEVEGLDYVCRSCAKGCWLNGTSKILRQAGVLPYIWMEADLPKILRNGARNGERLAVFGVACIPELVRGMRLCRCHGIPVLGVPLNANRCARWMGEFFSNSVSLGQIERLTALPTGERT